MKKRRMTVELVEALSSRLPSDYTLFPLLKTRNEVTTAQEMQEDRHRHSAQSTPRLWWTEALSRFTGPSWRQSCLTGQQPDPASCVAALDGAFWATSISTEVLCLVLTVLIGDTGRLVSNFVFVSSPFSDIDTVCLTAQQCQA